MDDAEQLMPVYLRFVKGVIDSSDLPLNVSREILQESRDVKAIREGSTKRVLSMLEDLADSEDEAEKDKYAAFWKDVRPGAEGRHRRGPREQASASRSSSLRVARTTNGTSRTSRSPTTSRA